MIKLIEIQQAIYDKLNIDFPTHQIYVGEMPQEMIKPAFFMQILPLSTIVENQYHRTRKVHVKIRCFTPNGTYLENLEMADQLNEVVDPVFSVRDRKLITHKTQTSIIDNVLNFAFNIEFIDSKAPNDQNNNYMEELIIKED